MNSRDVAFSCFWLLVMGISAYDACWVLANRNILVGVEANPVGKYLLHLNGGDVWLLLGIKLLGTTLAGMLLLLLYWFHPRLGWTACAATAGVQVALLAYLQK